jgi:ribosomal protein L29
MKKSDKNKWVGAKPTEINAQIVNLAKELVVARGELRLGKLANTRKTSRIRRDIAILKTLLTEKENMEAGV